MRLVDADSIQIPHFTLATDRIKMIDAIDEAPTIEPRRGEWIVDEDGNCRCSLCGVREEQFIYGLGEYWYGRGESNFCPNCGADMRKETVDYKHVVLTCDAEGNWSMHGERKESK